MAATHRVLAPASDCPGRHQHPTVEGLWPGRRDSHRQIPTPFTDGLSRSARGHSPKRHNKSGRPPPSSPGRRRQSPNLNGPRPSRLQGPRSQPHRPPSPLALHRRDHGGPGADARSDDYPAAITIGLMVHACRGNWCCRCSTSRGTRSHMGHGLSVVSRATWCRPGIPSCIRRRAGRSGPTGTRVHSFDSLIRLRQAAAVRHDFVPTAQWWGTARRNVCCSRAAATAKCHASTSSGASALKTRPW
jgi:hypothetical protein